MTMLDIIVLFLIGAGSVFGFARGFVQEALSLMAWIFVIVAIRILHGPVSTWLAEPIGTQSGAGVLAFLGIGFLTYFLGKWMAKSIGAMSRNSVLGPVDRILGFGFGAVKGLVVATLIFLLLIMGYETVFGGEDERPDWITESRTYPLLHASGNAMSGFVRDRRLAPAAQGEGS